MAKKEHKFDTFYDLTSWLNSEMGANALGHDSFTDLENMGFEQEAELGKQMHNLTRGLERISAQYAKLGLYPEITTLSGDRGTQILFKPTGPDAKSIKDSECPSIVISKTNNGYVVNNGMLAPNSPLLVRGQNGEVGIASAISVGLDQAAREIEHNMSYLQGEMAKSQKKAIALVKSKTSAAVRSVTQMSPSVYSYNQIKDASELDMKNMKVLRPEALAAMKSQMITGFYIQSVYNNSSKANKYGAPDEKRFTQMMNDIFAAARGFTNFSQLDNYVRGHYSWIYQNVWKGDVDNLFKKITGKLTQGGMTEGSVGRIAFKEADVPFANLQAPGKKIKQNLQLLKQNTNFFKGKQTAASGSTRIFSQSQYNAYQKKIEKKEMDLADMYKDMYTVAEFSDEDLKAAYDFFKEEAKKGGKKEKEKFKKLQQMSLKGFGEDASFMSQSLNKEFSKMTATKYLDGGVIDFSDVNKEAKEILLAQKKNLLNSKKGKKLSEQDLASLNKQIEELQKEEADVRKFDGGKRLIKNILAKKYNLDSMSEIKSYQIDKNGKFVDVLKSRTLYNQNAVVRGGATTDWRSVMSSLPDELAGKALEMHGYTLKQIYKNGKDASDGLIPNLFNKSGREIKDKTIRSDVMGTASYVFNHLRREGKSQKEIQDALPEELKKYFSITPNGDVIANDKQFEDDFSNDKGLGKEAATKLLQKVVEFGQKVGAYDANTKYFEEVNVGDKKYLAQLAPLMYDTELGLSSTERYAGLGRASHSTAKKTWREKASAEATLGDLSDWLISQGYKGEEYTKRITPFKNYVDILNERFKEKEKEYNQYAKNAEYMSKTFTKDATQFQKDVLADKRVITLSLDEIAKLDAEVNYDSEGLLAGEKVEGDLLDSNKVGVYLQRKREERFMELSEEDREKLGIKNANDIQVGVNLGEDSLTGKIDDQLLTTRMVMLGLGSYDKGKAEENVYMPDKELAETTHIIKTLQEYANAGANEKDSKRLSSLRGILRAYEYLEESYSSGSVFEKTHTIDDDRSSGYLLLQGMSEDSAQILKDIVGNQHLSPEEAAKVNKRMDEVTRIINSEDFKEMMRVQAKEDGGKSLRKMYSSFFGKGPGKKSTEKIIEAIADKLDISSGHYKGDVLESTMFNRNPTINFVNDLLGGSTVLTSKSNLVNKGNLMIKKELASVGHGDMDGDLVAFFLALDNGDLESAEHAISAYYSDLANYQKDIDKKDAEEAKAKKKEIVEALKAQGIDAKSVERIGEVSKANSVLDTTNKNVTIASMWSGKKGAGIYGNDKFAYEKILGDAVGTRNRQANRLFNLGGRVFAAIGQTLYQEGINIKNLKLPGAEKMTPEQKAALLLERSNAVMDMSTQRATWDTDQAREAFFDKMEDVGIFEKDNNTQMFKDNTLTTLGLNKITNNKQGKLILNDLEKLAKETKERLIYEYGEDSDKVKNIQRDIDEIERVQKQGGNLTNLGRELVNSLINVFAKDAFFAGEGNSLGARVSNLYNYLPGYASGNEAIPRLGRVTGHGDYDPRSREILGRFLTGNAPKDVYEDRYQQISKAKASGYNTSPSTDTKLSIVDAKGQIPADFEVIKLAEQFAKAKSEEEKKALVSQRNVNHQFLNKDEAALKAVLRGTIAHKVSELIFNSGKDFSAVNPDDALNYLMTADPSFKKEMEQQLKFIFPEEFGENQKGIEEFIGKAAFAGQGNYNYLQNKMKASKGVALGSEVPLAGFSNVENGTYNASNQISDFLYYTIDENGRATIHIADYKNAAGGKPTLANVAQLKDYEDSLRLLNKDVLTLQNKGKTVTDVDAYFGNETEVSKQWQKRLSDMASQDAGGATSGQAFREAFKKRKEEFAKVLEIMNKGTVNFAADLIVQSAQGVIHDYSLALNDSAFEEWFYNSYKKKMKGTDDLLAKDSEKGKELLERMIKGHTGAFGGTEDQALQYYSEDAKNLSATHVKLREAKARLKISKMEREALENRELPTEATQNRINALDNQERELKEQIGSKGAFKKVVEKEKQLEEEEKKLNEALNNHEAVEAEKIRKKIEGLISSIDKIKETLYYKAEEQEEELKKKYLTDQNNSTLNVGEDLVALEAARDEEFEKSLKKNEKEARDQLARKMLVGHNKDYKTLAKKVAEAEAKAASPLLNEEDKELAKAEAEELSKQKERVREAIIEEMKIISTGRKNKKSFEAFGQRFSLKNAKGRTITQEEAQKLGLYEDLDAIDSAEASKATRARNIADRRRLSSTETQIYEFYLTQFKLEEQITKLNKDLAKATEEGNEELAKVLEDKIESAKTIKSINDDSAKADFENMVGYSKELDEKQRKKAENQINLDRKLEKEREEKSRGGNGGGRDILGIDAYTVRWLQRIMQGGIVAGFIRMVRKGLKDITEKAKQLDQAMTNLRIVTGKSAENARTLVNQYAKLGKELGATTIEVTTAANAWIRQGYDISQVNDLVTASMYLSKLGMIDTAAATKDLTSAMKGFKLEASEAMDVVDKLTALDVKAATTAGDIAEGLSQFANIASLNGVSIDQASAYVATIADVTQASGTSVGQALKTIMSRYGNVKAGAYNKLDVGSEDSDTTEKLNDVERILSKMGIAIRKTNLEFKDFDEVLDEIAVKWGTMDNVSKKAVASAFAGIRQQENFLTLMENYDKYRELLQVSENSSGTAERKYQSYKESYMAAKNEFSAALEEFANSSEISKMLIDLTNVGKKIVELFQKIYPYLPGFISLFMTARAARGKGVLNKGYEYFKNRNEKDGDGGSKGGIFSLIKRRKKGQKSTEDKQEEQTAEAIVQKKKEELAVEQQIADVAQQEAQNKAQVAQNAQKEEQEKGMVVNSENQEVNAAQRGATLAAQELQKKQQGERVEEEVLEDRQQGAAAEKGAKGTGGNGGVGGGTKGGKVAAGLAFAEIGANILTTSLSQFATAGTTHEYNGETVESSKEAQTSGAAASAAISLVPVIGTILGPLAASWIAADRDKYRDEANYRTNKANKTISGMESIGAALENIGESEGGSTERHKLVQDFKKTIFDEENADLRKNLAKHLGGASISSLLESIDDNTAESEEALKKLQLAQLQSQKDEIADKYASTMYQQQEEMGEILSKLDNYSGVNAGNVWGGIGIGAGATLAGAGIGAAAGSVVPGLGTAIGAGVGAIVGAISGLIAGAVAGVAYTNSEAARERASYGDLSSVESWSAKNLLEKRDSIEEALEEAYQTLDNDKEVEKEEKLKNLYETIKKNKADSKFFITGGFNGEEITMDGVAAAYARAIENGSDVININGEMFNSPEARLAVKELTKTYQSIGDLNKVIAGYEDLIAALDRQTSIQNQILDEMDEITLQEALIAAKDEKSDKYLADMSIAELKTMGIQNVLTSYGRAIEEAGGLSSVGLWADENKTVLSEAGYDYLFGALRQQGDEEINAALSGEAYTLNEAFALRDKFGSDNYQVKRLLASFANALSLTVDELEEIGSKEYGLLTLADTMLSSTEIKTKTSELAELVNTITNGAGEMSTWMEELTSKFPALLKYTGDLNELYSQSIEYLSEYAKVYLRAQGQEYFENTGFYDSLKEELYGKISEDSRKSLDAANVSSFSGLVTWAQGQYNSETGKLTGEASEILGAVSGIFDERNLKLVSTVLKQFYDKLAEYKTKTIDYVLENLNAQKEALQDINSEREYENKLIEARLKLEEAENQRKRVYRAGVGWVYESDQAAIESAQKELDNLDREKKISVLEDQIATLEKQKKEISEIYDKENYENLRKLYEEAVDSKKISHDTNSAISDLKKAVEGISTPLKEYLGDQIKEKKEGKDKAVEGAKTAWETLTSAKPGTSAYNTALSNFYTAMNTAKAAGAGESDFSYFSPFGSNASGARNVTTFTTAWQMYNGGEDKYRTNVKKMFSVADPTNSKLHYVGFTNGDLLSNANVQNYLISDLGSGRVLVWTGSGKSFKNGERYPYAKEKTDTSLTEYFKRVSEYTGETQILLSDPYGENEAVFYDNGKIYAVTNDFGNSKEANGLSQQDASIYGGSTYFAKEWDGTTLDKKALGTLGLKKDSLNLINELGTEAIITPNGTVTALPSATGIIPADITKNLWELGEVAPGLVRILKENLPSNNFGSSIIDSLVNDESFNISNFTMNVSADSQFTLEKLVNMVRSRVALTKNNS